MKKYSLLLSIWVCVLSIHAQEFKRISLQDAFELAEKNSKQLSIDSLKILDLVYKKRQTQNAMLPILAVNASYARLSNNIDPFAISIPGVGGFEINTNIVNQYSNRFTIQQPIFQGLKNWNTMKAIEQQQQASVFDKEKNRQDLKLSIIQSYYGLYKMQQSTKLFDSTIAQTQVRVNDISKFKEAGLVLNNDVMRAELQKNNLQITQADIESSIAILNYNLCTLLGINTSTKLITEKPEVAININTSIQSLVSASWMERPEIKAQNFRYKASKYMVKAAKSAYMPLITAIGNGAYSNPNQRVFPPEAKFKATWDIGISLSWNIMQLYTARSIVADAKNQQMQLQLATSQMQDGISMEVNSNVEAVRVALLKIELANKAIEQASENKRILDNRFNTQVALLSDVLEADQLLLQAQTNLLNAQADVAIANFKLQRSLGTIK